MHIGFDISQTGTGKAGCGYFAHAMINEMLDIAPEHDYLLFPSFGDFYFDAKMPKASHYKGRNVSYGPLHRLKEEARTFWARPDIESLLNNPDIIHSNNFWCPVQLKTSRLIYTLYDITYSVEPSWTTEANRVGCFEGVFRSSIAADWVVAISEASKASYLDMFPHFPEERIRVIYPCSRFKDTTLKGKQPKVLKNVPAGKYWLNVGTIEPRKNQRCLVKAYARYLELGGISMPLVLAGGEGWLMQDFKKYVNELGVSDKVIMTGYVSEEELVWLYKNCCANLYPSLYEGFGLPVLEGMQFGAPTIASNVTSIPEITAKAAVLLDPKDIEGWAQAMLEISSDKAKREQLGIAGQKQAESFDCKDSVSALLKLYKQAMDLPKRVSL